MRFSVKNCFAIIVFITSIFCSTSCLKYLPYGDKIEAEINRQRIEHAEQMVKDSPDFKEVDDICRQIPVPENVTFITKGVANEQIVGITYYFLVPNEKYDDIKTLYHDYFAHNGWEEGFPEADGVSEITKFYRTNFVVIMQVGGMGPDVNYAFGCKKINSIE